jgi:hypothetical protein
MKNSKKDVSNSKNMGILYVPCKKCGGFPQLDFISDGEEFVRFECSCCDNSSGEVEIDPEEGLDRCIEKAKNNWNFQNSR